MKRYLTILAAALLMFTAANDVFAQAITGRVIDGSGIPLPGVVVQVEGTKNGTITDSAGKYSIEAGPL